MTFVYLLLIFITWFLIGALIFAAQAYLRYVFLGEYTLNADERTSLVICTCIGPISIIPCILCFIFDAITHFKVDRWWRTDRKWKRK
jgi:hypothetical protein